MLDSQNQIQLKLQWHLYLQLPLQPQPPPPPPILQPLMMWYILSSLLPYGSFRCAVKVVLVAYKFWKISWLAAYMKTVLTWNSEIPYTLPQWEVSTTIPQLIFSLPWKPQTSFFGSVFMRSHNVCSYGQKLWNLLNINILFFILMLRPLT